MTKELKNSDFTLTTKEEFSNLEDSDIVKTIKKYNIIESKDKLLDSNENNYLAIINHIDKLYYKKEIIPNDLKELIQKHTFFNKYLVLYINKKIDFLLKNGSAIFFKEIISMINLLSRGEVFNIFKDYNTYNYDEIQNLFREYEKALKRSLNEDSDLFEAIFDCYSCLLKVYTKLCLINSIDIKRKQTITPIIEILTETINMLKFSVKLETTNLDKLNNILGQLLYYFSHLPFVDSSGKDVNYIIDQYYLLFEKISDGYLASKDTNFAGNENYKEEEYLRFRNNSSYLLLIMLKKLYGSFHKEEYFISDSFKRCMLLYEKNFNINFIKDENITLESFREDLLNSLALTYETLNHKIGEIKDYKTAINDFIVEADNYNIHNLETIHDVLLLTDEIDIYTYINIGETLINSPLIKNDYYEFYKLKTLDIILNHISRELEGKDHIKFVRSIYTYIEKYKTASHLMPMFSKLYLSISFYFSKLGDKDSIQEARDIYIEYININGYDLLKNEYQYINKNLLYEFGKYHMLELNFNSEGMKKEEILSLGKIGIKNYLKYDDLKTKYEINDDIVKITSDILNTNNLNYQKLNDNICNLLTEKIFYGIAEISILGLSKKSSDIIDEGYKKHSIKIDEDYSIQFIFPAVYESNFKYVLDGNKDFIINNLKNILSSYKKESINFIHHPTGLENIHKLKIDLETLEGKEIIFLQIFVKSLSAIVDSYGLKVGEKYLQTIINKIESIIDADDKLYYLAGRKLGLYCEDKDKINSIIDKLLKFKLHKNGEELNIDFVISVTSAKNNVYEKSLSTLNKAIISKNNLLFYEQ